MDNIKAIQKIMG